MKKVVGIFFLIFMVCFSKINIKSYELKNDCVSFVAGESKTKFTLTTNSCWITGLGNAGIQFEVVGDRRLVNEHTGESIRLQNIYLDTVIGNRIGDILDSRGQVKFVVRAVAIKEGKLGRGYYSSRNLWLKVKSIFFGQTEYIPLKFQVYIYESLKVTTTEMNFGTQVIGERITTRNLGAEPGRIIITGHPNSLVRVDYPSEVTLKNESNGEVKVKLSDIRDKEIRLSAVGQRVLYLHGKVENSRFMQPGDYKGEVTIKVRYD